MTSEAWWPNDTWWHGLAWLGTRASQACLSLMGLHVCFFFSYCFPRKNSYAKKILAGLGQPSSAKPRRPHDIAPSLSPLHRHHVLSLANISRDPTPCLIAPDEGMTHRVLIFGLCGFKPRSKSVERMIKAHRSICLARRPWSRSLVHCKNSKEKTRSNSYSSRVLPTNLYVTDLENNPETQPSHIKGWEGALEKILHFYHLHLSAQILESTSPWLDSIYIAIVAHLALNTIAVKSDKQDVGCYPLISHKYRGSCVALSISKSVGPNEELKVG
jgi:hypothetical protein